MEIGSHTWEHPNMTTIPPEDIAAQFSRASDAIEAATGQRPKLVRTAGGLINDDGAGRGQEAGAGRHQLGCDPVRLGQRLQHRGHPLHADDADQAELGGAVPRHVLVSTVDLVYQFIPVLKANGYHLVTVSQMLGPRDAGQHATAAGTTARPPTIFTTSRPPKSRRCRTRRRRRRCRTSRSPTSRVPTPADRTTAPDARDALHQTAFVLTVLVLCYAVVSGLVKRWYVAPALIFVLFGILLGPFGFHVIDVDDRRSELRRRRTVGADCHPVQPGRRAGPHGGGPAAWGHLPAAGHRHPAGARSRHGDRRAGAARHAAVGGGVSGRDRRTHRGRADRRAAGGHAHPRTDPPRAVHRERVLRRLRAGGRARRACAGLRTGRSRLGPLDDVPGSHRGGVGGGGTRCSAGSVAW